MVTTLAAYEIVFLKDETTAEILRDSYICWAVFSTEATRKIWAEAQAGILAEPNKRAGVQIWHLFVVLVLWADISESVTGNAITNFLTKVFT